MPALGPRLFATATLGLLALAAIAIGFAALRHAGAGSDPALDPAVRAALADGTVTAEEYAAGINAVAACIRAAGFEVSEPAWDSSHTLMIYSYGGTPDREALSRAGAAARACSARYLGSIEALWLNRPEANKAAADLGAKVVACLQAGGISFPSGKEAFDARLQEVLQTNRPAYQACVNSVLGDSGAEAGAIRFEAPR